jgi:SNF2 family DNA or RNA helicase
MHIVHGTWIPEDRETFIQKGAFWLWVEKLPESLPEKQKTPKHPYALSPKDLKEFLTKELQIETLDKRHDPFAIRYFFLPSHNKMPLPSPEAMRYAAFEEPEEFELSQWEVPCFELQNVIKKLQHINFICLTNPLSFQPATDLVFWYHYTRSFREILIKELYIPGLKYHAAARPARKGKMKNTEEFAVYPCWEIVAEKYDEKIKKYCNHMPLVCTAGFETPAAKQTEFHDREGLLRHFSECLLQEIITETKFTQKLDNQIKDTLVHYCAYPTNMLQAPMTNQDGLILYKKWASWKEKLTVASSDAAFTLGFRLIEARSNNIDYWVVEFMAASKNDPSMQISLSEYWALGPQGKRDQEKHFGADFQKKLLLNMGFAARIYPKIWDGLETQEPGGFVLNLNEAFAFLRETSWVLEDAGYRVIVPSWWTPQGRRRAKIRLKSSQSDAKPAAGGGPGKGHMSLESVIQYSYELSIGDEQVSHEEWQELVNAKAPLVLFRGQWIELDRDKMEEMLEFWEKHESEQQGLTFQQLLKMEADNSESIVFDYDDALAGMMDKLRDKSRFELVDEPAAFTGTLRPYQRRGVSWLDYLEQIGLNPCLADDMGLGKTVQVIALLAREQESAEAVLPTLLIAPTSVLGNWEREVQRFAPALKTFIHHGPKRTQDKKEFHEACANNNLIITSFALARRDEKLLNAMKWQRIIVDEAQNIKNPDTAQTRAIGKLQADFRLALTGTPIENRLMDLWSIFNFLNPGYLGKQAWFKKIFEIPIQRDNSIVQSEALKKLVEPFILRRVKTDKSVIADLPDKVEHKQYCNLTKEQASLYEAVVQEVNREIDKTEGIQRKGLMLATLMKLKQICNHPVQFLQDGSAFTEERSHKLKRLTEMVEEVTENDESLLVFSQFKEIGDALQQYFRQTMHCNTYFIHGGTPRHKREQFIEAFQDEDSEPSVFVLSLKAGGVGITLTRANHVFHFDRWWNPAVEEQATDRAFRIGQKKNVFVHKFITIGTLEERIDAMLEEKKSLSSSIIGADESWLTDLDNKTFKNLIQLSKEAVLEE